jgi:hypothetical protein
LLRSNVEYSSFSDEVVNNDSCAVLRGGLNVEVDQVDMT